MPRTKSVSIGRRRNVEDAANFVKTKRRHASLCKQLAALTSGASLNIAKIRLMRFEKINLGDPVLVEYKDNSKPPVYGRFKDIKIIQEGNSLADIIIELSHPHEILMLKEGKYSLLSCTRNFISESVLADNPEFYLKNSVALRDKTKYGSVCYKYSRML